MDKLVAMQVFITTVDCGSQSAAAQKLGLSRPVVSRYLGELEDWAGARLLHRTTRRLSLTDAGAEALARCRQLLELAKGIQLSVGEPSGVPRGRLHRHGAPRHVEELSGHNCLLHSFYGKSTWTFRCGGEELAVPVTGNLSANDAAAIEQAVLYGAGLAMLPAYMALPLIDRGDLVALLPECEAMPMDIYAIYATRKNMPVALSKLIEFLERSFKDARLG